MGKKAKEHRKKVAKRNEKINSEKKKIQKLQMDYLNKLIAKEQAAGKFDNDSIESVQEDLLSEGPQI